MWSDDCESIGDGQLFLLTRVFVALTLSLVVYVSSAPAQTTPEPECGDIDCSASITATDALATLQLAVGLDPGPICRDRCEPLLASTATHGAASFQLGTDYCADVDCSGSIAATDALVILRVSVGEPIPRRCGLDCELGPEPELSFATPFLFGTGGNPVGLYVAKVDEGNNLDVVVASRTDRVVYLLRGLGGGFFGLRETWASCGGSLHNIVLAHNVTGRPELYLGVVCALPGPFGSTNHLYSYAGAAAATLTVRQVSDQIHTAPTILKVGSLYGHGSLSPLIAGGETISALPNLFNARLLSAAARHDSATDFVVIDADGNGLGEVVITNPGNDKLTIIGDDGSLPLSQWTGIEVGTEPMGIVGGDFDRDSMVDLAVAEHGDQVVSILYGRGDGSFSPRTSFPAGLEPDRLYTGDLNGDNRSDLVALDPVASSVAVLLSDASGNFDRLTVFDSPGTPVAAAIADVNADGLNDLIILNYDDANVAVYLNTTGVRN